MTAKSTSARLSDNDLQRYESDGYLSLPGFLAGDSLDAMLSSVVRLLNDVLPTIPVEQVFLEDRSNPQSLKQVQHLEQHDAWFHDQSTKGPFFDLAEFLLGEKAVLKNIQYFNKPAGIGTATPAHQDGYYFMLSPCNALTMWLALDNVDDKNGCVRYVTGSHRYGMRNHSRTNTLGFSQGIADYPTSHDVKNEHVTNARPGDLLVHDAMTIHRAEANTSPSRDRRAIGFIFYGVSAKEDRERHQAYQQELTADWKRDGKL